MSDVNGPQVTALSAMRVAAYWTFDESPAKAFAALRLWAERQGVPPAWKPRFFGFPNPDPFGPGFEAWMSIPPDLPVEDERIRAREFPAGLSYAVFPPGWGSNAKIERWVAKNTPGYGMHQGFHEYVFAEGKSDLRSAATWVHAPISKEPTPFDLQVVSLPPMEFCVISLPDLDDFLRWFHTFVGAHPPDQRAAIQIFQAPAESYDAWVVSSSSPLAQEATPQCHYAGGRYARVTTAEVMLPKHIGEGWNLAQQHGCSYDGSRRFLIEPHRHRNEITWKSAVHLYYPVQ